MAQLLLENTRERMPVYVVVCSGKGMRAIPRAVHSREKTAMAFCEQWWQVTPEPVMDGYWRIDIPDLDMTIEVYRLELVP